jgi:uncharacterized protein (TIRG00374 family)
MTKAKVKKIISYTSRFAVAAAALYIASRKENIKDVATDLWKLNLWVFAAATAIYMAGQLIFVSRWYLLLRVQSIKIHYWTALRLHLLGLFYNNCLPGSVGGDFLRAWYVTKHTDKKVEAAISVFVDRAVGLIGVFIMAVVAYLFIPAEGQKEPLTPSYSINLLPRLGEHKGIVIVVAAVIVICIAAFILTQRGRCLLQRTYKAIRRRSASLSAKAYMAIRLYLAKGFTMFIALLLTFACQGVAIISVWLIGREINNTIQIKYYLIFLPVSWLLGMLPISVGGAGVMELWLKEMFEKICMIPGSQALAIALWQRIVWLLVSLPGVVIHLIGAHLPKDFSVDYKSTID